MVKNISVEKINDFVDIWAQSIGLKNTSIIQIIKNDIVKRSKEYVDVFPTISVNLDSCQAYIIKPVNGEYAIEDFFLNRLILGISELNLGTSLEGTNAGYNGYEKSLDINIEKMRQDINERATRHRGLVGVSDAIIVKTVEHELGHCFKTSFNDGLGAIFSSGTRANQEKYKKIIQGITTLKNGKYASQIKSLAELNFTQVSEKIKTGVKDSVSHYRQQYRFDTIDELLNETEALKLASNNKVHEIVYLEDHTTGQKSNTGNYVKVYNYMSGYRSFTGYGDILRTLITKKNCFMAEYISSTDLFDRFDKLYSDVVQEVWGLDSKEWPPLECLAYDFYDLQTKRPHFDETIMLKLDMFFARCYQKKIYNYILNANSVLSHEEIGIILSQIQVFQEKMTTNDDPLKRANLAHNIIFNEIKGKLQRIQNLGNNYTPNFVSQKSNYHR